MALPAPEAILFDWDNTLVDTWPVIHEAMVATFTAMGHEPWTLAQTKERVSKSMRDAFPELFGDRWEEAGDIYQAHYKSNHLQKLQPLPGAHEVLLRVKELGLFCGVVSNKKGPTLRQEVEHMGWNALFDTVVGSDDAAKDKPYPEPVHFAFRQSHIKPASHVWFVGDSHVDLEVALNTGCTAILFGAEAGGHALYTPTHFQGMPYQAHVTDHAQMLGLLSVSPSPSGRGPG